MLEHVIKVLPDLFRYGRAIDDLMRQDEASSIPREARQGRFRAVVLEIHSASDAQNLCRYPVQAKRLDARGKRGVVNLGALLAPRLTQHSVDEDLQAFRVVLCGEKSCGQDRLARIVQEAHKRV